MIINGIERPLRIMELRSTYRWGGGPDKTILNSANLHDPKRLMTLVVYLRSDWDTEFSIAEKARQMGINFVELVEHRVIDLKIFKSIINLIKTNQIDILHSRDYKSNLYALIIKKFFCRKIKIVTTAHGWVGSGFKLSLYYTLDKLLVASFDRNFILFKDQTRDFYRKPRKSQTVVIHNAIDQVQWDFHTTPKGTLRKELNLNESSMIIGFVGRIMPEKDIVSMILVADELINRRKIDCYFVLVGESKDLSYDDKLKKLLIEKRLEQRVFFTGKRNNLQNIYVDFNLFLMTSLQEGFPNSLLEAMAMGVASVVTSIDGIPEIIKNKESGILVKPKDILGITDEIELLLNDTNLREAIAAKARNIVETDLSFERRLRKMEDQYEALMVGN
jgi:glycosyltransferase involved in cell wall biosynthesis